MIGAVRTPSQQLVTVFGASGFLGRHVVRGLAKRGYRIRAAVRRPELAGHLQPLGSVGQIHAIRANLRNRASIEHAVANADVVINLVGILQPRGAQSFQALHAQGARWVAEAAAAAGARALIHVSALGADPHSESAYARTKAAGEHAVAQAYPDALIVRPSVLFGPGDSFFNRFAALARALPVLPLAGAATRFQPVAAADVAEGIVRAADGTVAGGRVLEFGGPEIWRLEELVRFVLHVTGRKRLVLPLPFGLARIQAQVGEILDAATLGLMPDAIKLTRDQVALLRHDNVVSEAAVREGRTLAGIGITPTALEAVVPSYLVRFRAHGQFDEQHPSQEFDLPDQGLEAGIAADAAARFHPEPAPGSVVGDATGR